jgi:hypothetical protein
MENSEKDWKPKLRYGKIQTPYKHFTLIAEGITGELEEGFECPPGNAFMGMKVWAFSDNEAADMIQVIGKQIGFTITGSIQIYDTEPQEPPGENPHGYDIKFTPFEN